MEARAREGVSAWNSSTSDIRKALSGKEQGGYGGVKKARLTTGGVAHRGREQVRRVIRDCLLQLSLVTAPRSFLLCAVDGV